MKFFKNTLLIVTIFTIIPVCTTNSATKNKKTTRARTARKTPARRAPVVQQAAITPTTYEQVLASLKTITPALTDYSTLISIRTEIDRLLSLLPNIIVQKINNLDDTILDTMEAAGGHALAKHVDQSRSDMALRLLRENIEAASTFTNKQTATKAVKENLKHNAEKIASWLASNPDLNQRAPFYYTYSYVIGESVVRGKENVMRPSKKSIVVLAPDPTNDLGFRIVTAYPAHK